MSNVFVLDTTKRPLDPVHPGRARLLLKQGKAAVWRMFPFTLILKREVEQPEVHPLRIKIDPGSNVTGIALVNDRSGEVVFAAELTHRGRQIKEALTSRRAVRRRRRARKTRYRKPKFENRRRPAGWLAPSLESRIHHIMAWIARLRRYAPISAISQELVCFDMQSMENSSKDLVPLLITATGHGSRQMCSMNKYGFVRTGPKQSKCVKGFMTGDMVRAIVTSGVHVGTYVGKAAVRANGSFNITTTTGKVQGISSRFCMVIHHADGYTYQRGGRCG